MTQLRWHDGQAHITASEEEPYPVRPVTRPGDPPVRVAGRTVKVGPLVFLTGANSAYAATDAMGGKFEIQVPTSGIIQGARILDADDDTFTATIHLFSEDFTETADNAVYAVTDEDFQHLECSILVDTFRDAVISKIGIEDNLGIAYTAPAGKLYGQVQIQSGTPTIAAGVKMHLWLYILADD